MTLIGPKHSPENFYEAVENRQLTDVLVYILGLTGPLPKEALISLIPEKNIFAWDSLLRNNSLRTEDPAEIEAQTIGDLPQYAPPRMEVVEDWVGLTQLGEQEYLDLVSRMNKYDLDLKHLSEVEHSVQQFIDYL